jgi:hypothetical protein
VLEVLGAGAVEELLEVLDVLGVPELVEDAPVGDVGPLLSQPMEAASPRVIAPPLRRRRKSRRWARALRVSGSSIFRSFWSAMPSEAARPGPELGL